MSVFETIAVILYVKKEHTFLVGHIADSRSLFPNTNKQHCYRRVELKGRIELRNAINLDNLRTIGGAGLAYSLLSAEHR